MDKVSVIIPTYNRYGYLTRAIASVQNQTHTDMEIVIVDDNGVGTETQIRLSKLMAKYADDPRVRYLPNETNVGGAMARNAGIFAATGSYISFLDDDDEYLPEKTEVQLAFMQANDLDACIMDLAGYNEEGERISTKRQAFPAEPTAESLLVQHMLHHLTGTPTFMYRAEKLREIGGFPDMPAANEYFLMLRSIEAGLRIGYLPEIHTRCYTHSGERLSTGPKKMQVLSLLLESKKQNFHLLTNRQRRYVLCKHYGTVFYMHYINKHYWQASRNLAAALWYSPKGFYDSYQEKKGRFYSK